MLAQLSSIPNESQQTLNRFGVEYPYLKAAWAISRKYNIPAYEVLIASGIICENQWAQAQGILAQERARVRNNIAIRNSLLNQAVHGLLRLKPEYSAHQTFTRIQSVLIGLCLASLAFLLFTHAGFTIFTAILVLTVFYTFNVLTRGALLATFDQSAPSTRSLVPVDDRNLPAYTVLVALYNESEQIYQLVQHLWQLDWPQKKLDIKLICEADDLETIAAIKDLHLPAEFDLVLVPPVTPRTKPRALNFALPLARGQYLVLYDAEDKPHSGQLREAYERFKDGPAELACLQAPLRIYNHDQNWLCKMFAIEYLTLFNGILPVLAKWKVPLPLGGTSNHFKIEILREVGAWDPFNVTEDADLGVRLFREGYRSETITLPTYEEAPPNITLWIRQRTRWIKGWMQTVLVHNRNPIALFRDLGLRNGLAFHLFMTSLIVSVIIHPVFVIILGYQLLDISEMDHKIDSLILGASIFNFVGGYTTYGILSFAVLKTTGNGHFSRYLLTIPFYWALISIAGWRAVLHLLTKPHKWEKTPHGLANCDFQHTLS